jgi:hypothetical protein
VPVEDQARVQVGVAAGNVSPAAGKAVVVKGDDHEDALPRQRKADLRSERIEMSKSAE